MISIKGWWADMHIPWQVRPRWLITGDSQCTWSESETPGAIQSGLESGRTSEFMLCQLTIVWCLTPLAVLFQLSLPVHLSMLSWSFLYHPSVQYCFQANGCYPTYQLSKLMVCSAWMNKSCCNDCHQSLASPRFSSSVSCQLSWGGGVGGSGGFVEYCSKRLFIVEQEHCMRVPMLGCGVLNRG